MYRFRDEETVILLIKSVENVLTVLITNDRVSALFVFDT